MNAALLAMVAVTAAACGTAKPPGTSSAALDSAAPQVQDCTVISLSVPTKYACNGKVYTSNELEQLRQTGPPGRQ